MAAATVAQYDPAWASPSQWGGMVDLLIADANNWDRTDTRFPFLRSHDAYTGHSWAAGHGDFGDGNNQESSSESMNFATAAILWGEATGQTDRDLPYNNIIALNENGAVLHYRHKESDTPAELRSFLNPVSGVGRHTHTRTPWSDPHVAGCA